MLFCIGSHLVQTRPAGGRVGHDHTVVIHHAADQLHFLIEFLGGGAAQREAHHVHGVVRKDSVAVRIRFRGLQATSIAAGTFYVDSHHVDIIGQGDVLHDGARKDIGAAACGVGNNTSDGAAGIIIRGVIAGGALGSAGNQTERHHCGKEQAKKLFHTFLLFSSDFCFTILFADICERVRLRQADA